MVGMDTLSAVIGESPEPGDRTDDPVVPKLVRHTVKPPMDTFFILDTPKSFEEASAALQKAADPSLHEVARAVEASTTAIIEAAAA